MNQIPKAPVRPQWVWVPVAALVGLAIASVTLILLATRRGPGLSPDSVYYFSSGINLAHEARLVDYSGQPLTVFAPAYPVLIAVGVKLGIAADGIARIMLVLSGIATVVLGNVLLRRVLSSPVLMWLGTLLVAASPALIMVQKMAWTEPEFVPVVLALVLVLQQVWMRKAVTLRLIVLAVVLCWAGFLLRYSGVTLIATGSVAILLSLRARPLRALFSASGFFVLAASVPVCWVLRNRATDGTNLGARSPSQDGVRDVVDRLTAVVGGWIFPSGPAVVRTLPVLLVVGCVGVCVWVARNRRASGEQLLPTPSPVSVAVLFAIFYVVYLAAAQLTSAFDPIDNRLLSPAYVPCIAIGCLAIERSQPIWLQRSRPIRLVAAAIGTLWLGAQLTETLVRTNGAFADGAIFTASRWRDSPLANAVKDLPDVGIVYVNGEIVSYHVWTLSRDQPTRIAVGWFDGLANDIRCAGGPSFLAWFGAAGDRPPATSPQNVVSLTLVSEYADGALYALKAVSVDLAVC